MRTKEKAQAKLKNGASQIEKWHKLNWKIAQAIFLSGAWGKILDFMGKNHPTPRATMAFSHVQNYPPKT